ncbi:hypothetical protein [Arabiibacter massiliensis]|uniref:hypothetical protein n=1 Tax=Arabiibacter massiliensis TaxID=1870985 RepID=UPI0009BC0882|nr:hypothetical protein [Arabiibacter massiliensis]
MKKIIGVLLGLVALVIVGVVGVFALSGPNAAPGPVSDAANEAKAAVTNAALDASGVKDQVKNAIDANRDSIAAATGLTDEQLDAAIADLDIDSWQAAPLPADAKAAGTVEGAYAGIEGTITTYDDPGYVTIEAYGQTVTLEVPESAQQYLPFLAYAQ